MCTLHVNKSLSKHCGQRGCEVDGRGKDGEQGRGGESARDNVKGKKI